MTSFGINFDEASKAWRMNKKKVGKTSFEYVCGASKKDGKPCQSVPYTWSVSYRRDFEKKNGYKPMRGHSLCRRHLREEALREKTSLRSEEALRESLRDTHCDDVRDTHCARQRTNVQANDGVMIPKTLANTVVPEVLVGQERNCTLSSQTCPGSIAIPEAGALPAGSHATTVALEPM